MQAFIENNQKLVKLVLVLLGLFLFAAFLGKLKEVRFIGSGVSASNTITVQGEGKIDRAPDTAKVSFTVRNEAKNLKTAQDTVSTKVDAISKALKDLGIEEKYIKTDSYNSYPQYNYPSCVGGICPTGGPTIRGYEVAHTVTVSVKDLDKVNDVLGVLGQNGVSDITGPNFGFEDDKAVAREARDLAIADAKNQAKALAKSLGVHLVRIVSFSENGSGMPVPVYAQREALNSADAKGGATPNLPVGDQSVRSAVTVVYEIR
jgi:uncharacterized protein